MHRTGFVVMSMCCAGLAQADTVQQPTLQPQDTWAYRNTVEQRPNAWHQTHVESTILRVAKSTVLIRNTEVGSPNPPVELMVNADWSRFRSIDGHETVVHKPLSFPLSPNKAWDLEFVDTHPKNTGHKSEQRNYHYTVVGWEDVEVPAGKFKALKVEAEGTWTAEIAPKVTATVSTQADANGTSSGAQTVKVAPGTVSGRLYEVAWYAPDVKREVKSVGENYDTNGVRSERTTVELESYKLAN